MDPHKFLVKMCTFVRNNCNEKYDYFQLSCKIILTLVFSTTIWKTECIMLQRVCLRNMTFWMRAWWLTVFQSVDHETKIEAKVVPVYKHWKQSTSLVHVHPRELNSLTMFHAKFELYGKSCIMSFKFQRFHNKILHMPWQLYCRGMCNILLWFDGKKSNDNRLYTIFLWFLYCLNGEWCSSTIAMSPSCIVD